MEEVEIVHEVVEEKEPNYKNYIIVALVIALIIVGYFVLNKDYDPGRVVDQETFLQIFSNEQKIIIFMDVRGVTDPIVRQNIFQCGVDFAGSSGMGPKDATYFSLGDVGCVTPEGDNTDEYCFNELKNTMTIYIHQGDSTTYHSKGMMVGVNANYDEACGIHAT